MDELFKFCCNADKAKVDTATLALNNSPWFPRGGTVKWVDKAYNTTLGLWGFPEVPEASIVEAGASLELWNQFLIDFELVTTELTQEQIIQEVTE